MEGRVVQVTSDNKELGRQGEVAAIAYVKKKKYKILEKNFRALRGEIDIIAQNKNTLVFIEVKSQRQPGFGEPEERVHIKKQKQIGKIAAVYLQNKEHYDIDCRFDVITVSFHQSEPVIEHFEDAFWLDAGEL